MTGSSQRLHPISVLFLVLAALRGFLLPAVVVIFTARSTGWEVWALFFSIPSAIYAVFRYFTTRYTFGDDELVVRTGLLFKNERHIRYSRIQNIETVRNPLHRALNVAEVRVETGGGAEQEAKLQVLSLPAVDEMRRRVFEGKQRAGVNATEMEAGDEAGGAETGTPQPWLRGGDATGPASAPSEPARVLVKLGLRDLVVFGLVQNRGGIVIAAVLGVLWEADLFDWDGSGSDSIVRISRRVFDLGWFPDWGVAVAVGLIAIFLTSLVVVRVLSIGWAIVRLYDFTLTRVGDELRTSCGLFTKFHAVIPLRRIQLITMRQAPLQRAFRCVEVRVQTAGGDKNASASREWLAPTLRRDAVDALLSAVLPGPGFDSVAWRPVDARVARRELRESLRLIAIPFLAAVWFVPWIALAGAAVLSAVAFLAARKRAPWFGYALTDDRVFCREGWLWRNTSLARYAKLQVVKLGESPFDRRWKMAGVSADTAGGGSHRVSISYLPIDEARAVFDELGTRVNQTAFRW